DLGGAESFVIKLDQGLLSLQVALVKPDKCAIGLVRGDFAVSISMLSICFVGNVDFVLEELVEGLEVLGDFVSYVGKDVSEKKSELEVVIFISIKGRHSSGGMGGVVLGELCQGQFHAPVVLQVVNIEAEVLLQGLVHLFSLAINFQVVDNGEVSLYLEGLTQRLPEPGHEKKAVIKYNVIWKSMLGEDMFKEEFGKLWGVVGGVAEDEDGLLGEAADDDKDGIETL
ncbi:hypothetical protein C0993_000827, partial [Termitomyces sp. T159_Od127]